MNAGPIEIRKERAKPTARRVVKLRPVTLFGIALFAASGWGFAAYERLVSIPDAFAGQRISTALAMVDKFYDSDGQRAYVKLSEDLKPWWDMIQEQQRKIIAATSDVDRDALIASRDELLVAFIRQHELGGSIDLLVASFDPFDRCLAAEACDEEILRKSIGIDVRRIYRTFKPYVQSRREGGKPEDRDKDFGRGLENLFFRFLG